MPGCHFQGVMLDEALANIREAADPQMEVQAERATRSLESRR